MQKAALKRIHRVIWIIFWMAMLGTPIAYFFVGPQLVAPPGPLTGLYDSAVQLLGEWATRIVFCGVWLAFGVALLWRLVLSKNRDKVNLDPLDLHD